jgi:fatty-acid peroxygenase
MSRTTRAQLLGDLGERLPEDLALRLAVDPYGALARLRAANGGSDWYRTRMLGRPALVVRGADGVRAFYDTALVRRRGAVPAPVRLTLFGPGAVHGLDDEQHARRKHLFLRMVDISTVARLTEQVVERLDEAVEGWTSQDTVRLFDELVDIYGSAALAWSGTGTVGQEASVVSRDLATIVDGFGVRDTAYPRAIAARLRAERWALTVMRDLRAGRRTAPQGSAAGILAAVPRRELPPLAAATELLNVVRPTVAVAYFGAYAAHALDRRPDWRAPLAAGSHAHLRAFELEIRRWYPFVPLLTGRLRQAYEWEGQEFAPRAWIVLDVLGTNRDPRLWERPDEFLPERFLHREPTEHDYVPQGGGHPGAGHRCPGEPLAAAIVRATVERLARLHFELAPGAREVPLGRIPSLPSDGVALLHVTRT